VVGGGHPAIDRLLQQDFLDIVRREAAFGERRAHVKAEFIPLAEHDHGADHQHPPGALVEMRPGPDFAPRMARDQIEELGVERILVGDRFIDPGIAEHLAALRCRHPCVFDRPCFLLPVGALPLPVGEGWGEGLRAIVRP
jgi:hypothetical protein